MPRAVSPGWIRGYLQLKTTEAADLSGTGAVTLLTSFLLGFGVIIEEFGFICDTALAGTAGTQTYKLRRGSATGDIIATLTVALADGVKGQTTKTTTMVAAYKELVDTHTLSLTRESGGTTLTAGAGRFYVKYRQRAQQIG